MAKRISPRTLGGPPWKAVKAVLWFGSISPAQGPAAQVDFSGGLAGFAPGLAAPGPAALGSASAGAFTQPPM